MKLGVSKSDNEIPSIWTTANILWRVIVWNWTVRQAYKLVYTNLIFIVFNINSQQEASRVD